MYIERLTKEQLFDLTKKCLLIHKARNLNVKRIEILDATKKGIPVLAIDNNDNDIGYYILGDFKVEKYYFGKMLNPIKYTDIMIKHFGEEYADSLLKYYNINPNTIKNIYSLPTDWEDK